MTNEEIEAIRGKPVSIMIDSREYVVYPSGTGKLAKLVVDVTGNGDRGVFQFTWDAVKRAQEKGDWLHG